MRIISVVALFSIMVGGGIVGAIIGITKLETARCGWRWNESGYENKLVGGVGCMVQIEGRWFPESAVSVRPRS